MQVSGTSDWAAETEALINININTIINIILKKIIRFFHLDYLFLLSHCFLVRFCIYDILLYAILFFFALVFIFFHIKDETLFTTQLSEKMEPRKETLFCL